MTKFKTTLLDLLFPGVKGYQLRRNLKALRLSLILGVVIASFFGVILFYLNQQGRL